MRLLPALLSLARLPAYGLLLVLMLPLGCTTAKGIVIDPAEPAFSAALFTALSSQITNPYFPLRRGISIAYTEETDEGVETIIVETLLTTRLVDGVVCAIVRDRVYLDGLLLEDTHDWYAQDRDGNVWYMGEEVVNFEYDDDGNLLGTDSDGSWESGLDVAAVGALARAGIIMKAILIVGDKYGQEFYPGEAEDTGEVFALDVPVTLEDGSFFRCLKTRDLNPLEPGIGEFKYYAPGMGLVLSEKTDGSDRGEYKGSFDLTPAGLPDFGAASFPDPTRIDNTFLPWSPGNVRTFLDEADEDPEVIVVEVLETTRVIAGVECVEVQDRVYVDDLLIEDTIDWYCQDSAGNVWYMGEEVTNYNYDDDGNLLGTDSGGSWEAGVDGAEAGIAMWALPVIGASYRQEFYEDEAEDVAVLVGTGLDVDLPCGVSFRGCLKILEWTPLEADALEYKYYAPGHGVIMESPLDGSEPVQFSGSLFLGDGSLPEIGTVTFTNPSELTNPWLAFATGAVQEFEFDTEEGLEEIVVEVLAMTRTVDGLLSRVVSDRVFLDGVLIEETLDWYAQDDAGNVWYMGEDVTNYNYDDDGNFLGTDSGGSWEAGVDGAEAGIVMWATPIVGRSYRQEFYEDEAEDMGVIIATGVTVTLEDGTVYLNCLKVLEWTPIEPSALEYKFYALGIGVVAEQPLPGTDRVERSGP